MKGVFLGRMAPIHFGHEIIIKQMIKECGRDNCLIIIGSANAPTSMRNIFSYGQRRHFIKSIFDLPVVGLPDYYNNSDWLTALDDILLTADIPSHNGTMYFGGYQQDIDFFLKDGRECRIINRFGGTTPKISASEVRDCLIYENWIPGIEPLDHLVNSKIIQDLKHIFEGEWARFKKI